MDMMAKLENKINKNHNVILHKIEKRLSLWQKCCVFFGNYFIELGSAEAIREALDILVKNGVVYKVGVNLYCYPAKQISMIMGSSGTPTLAEIGNAIDSRGNCL